MNFSGISWRSNTVPGKPCGKKKKKKRIKRRILNNYEFLSFYFTFTLYILYLGHFINIRRILCGHRFHFLSISCQDGRVGLIHHMCVLISQSCPILWDQMDCSLPGSSVHGISQARILEWVAISSSRGSSWPRDQTHVPYTGTQILIHSATREIPKCFISRC